MAAVGRAIIIVLVSLGTILDDDDDDGIDTEIDDDLTETGIVGTMFVLVETIDMDGSIKAVLLLMSLWLIIEHNSPENPTGQ